jgi:hypothetical protein
MPGHGLRGLERKALHGELVVPGADGTGTRTLLVQRGEVTAVTGDSLTVKSTDGFTRTYTVDASARVNARRDGLASITVGATVRVLAEKVGDGARALAVRDRTGRPDKGQHHLPRPGGPGENPPGTPGEPGPPSAPSSPSPSPTN